MIQKICDRNQRHDTWDFLQELVHILRRVSALGLFVLSKPTSITLELLPAASITSLYQTYATLCFFVKNDQYVVVLW